MGEHLSDDRAPLVWQWQMPPEVKKIMDSYWPANRRPERLREGYGINRLHRDMLHMQLDLIALHHPKMDAASKRRASSTVAYLTAELEAPGAGGYHDKPPMRKAPAKAKRKP